MRVGEHADGQAVRIARRSLDRYVDAAHARHASRLQVPPDREGHRGHGEDDGHEAGPERVADPGEQQRQTEEQVGDQRPGEQDPADAEQDVRDLGGAVRGRTRVRPHHREEDGPGPPGGQVVGRR